MNKQSIRFSNEKVRTVADRLAQTYYSAKRVLNEWQANDLEAQFSSDKTEIDDGAKVDGRSVILAEDVKRIIGVCQELVNDFEANDNEKLNSVLRVAVHND